MHNMTSNANRSKPAPQTILLVDGNALTRKLLKKCLETYGYNVHTAADGQMGFDLAPITDRLQIIEALQEILNLPGTASAGHVVAFDLQTVAVDLTTVPLDEVLDFREQHRDAHRRYIRSLRQFARELSLLPAAEQQEAFGDRQAALDDYASDVKRAARTAWLKKATVAVGLSGAAWTMTGDPVAGLFAACGALIPSPKPVRDEYGAFSYLLSAHQRYA